MDAQEEKRLALRLLNGLEAGTIATADATLIVDDIDPVYVYLIVEFLRHVYPASDPAATSVLERVVALTSAGAAAIRKHHDGEQDPVSRWFVDDYGYDAYRGRGTELLELIADKLDS